VQQRFKPGSKGWLSTSSRRTSEWYDPIGNKQMAESKTVDQEGCDDQFPGMLLRGYFFHAKITI